MRKKLCAFVGGALLLTSSLSMAANDNKILVTVGSESLNQGQFNMMVDNMPPQLQMMLKSQPELRTNMLGKWAEFSILAQEASASGIGDDAEVQQKIQELSNRILVEEYIKKNTGQAEVNAEMVKAYYNDNAEQFSRSEEVQAQHILITVGKEAGAEDQAKAKKTILSIQQQLKDGKDFAALAKEFSDDPGSGANGGDLGFFSRGKMVPEFEDAAFSTKKGEVSEPVQTQFGWHLIKVNDRKEAGTISLAEVQDQIEQNLRQQQQQQEVVEILAKLKDKYPVKIGE